MGGNTANLLEEIRKSKADLAVSSETIIQAHSSFTSQYNTFLSLSEQIENKFKELEIRERAVEIREDEVRDCKQRVQERERILVNKEQALEMRSSAITAKFELWNEIEKVMKQNADKMASVVRFSVCGTKFEITKERLLSFEGSLFEHLIVSNNPVLNSNGEIFIERDPQHFRHVLNFMLGETIQPPPTAAEQRRIEKEFEHFKIPFEFVAAPVTPPDAPKEDIILAAAVEEWLPNKAFLLIYKASRDGFAAKDFHAHCDEKGPTFTIIRSSNGYLFGAYSKIPWDSTTNSWKNSSSVEDTFIFTLTNPHNIPPTKYHCHNQQQHVIYCNLKYGPGFGVGCDILVSDNSNQLNNSFTNFPASYKDTTGKGNYTFTGDFHFTTSEIDVYSVV